MFRFTLNVPARVTLAFTRRIHGRRVSGRCVSETGRNRHARSCLRTVTVATLTIAGHAGRNRITFDGRLRQRRSLAPGRYAVVLRATDGAGRHSARRTLRFTIVAG